MLSQSVTSLMLILVIVALICFSSFFSAVVFSMGKVHGQLNDEGIHAVIGSHNTRLSSGILETIFTTLGYPEGMSTGHPGLWQT